MDHDSLPISIIHFSLQHSSWQWIKTACLFPSYTSHYSNHPGSGSRQPAYFIIQFSLQQSSWQWIKTACLFPSYTSHYSIHPGSGSRQPAYFHHTLLTTAFILAVDQDSLPISIIHFSLQHSSWQWITTACLFPSYTSHYSNHPGSGSRQPAYFIIQFSLQQSSWQWIKTACLFHHTLLTTAIILAVDQDSLPISIIQFSLQQSSWQWIMTACLFPSYTSHYSIHPGSGSRQPAYFHHTLLTTAFILAVDHNSLPISIIHFSLQHSSWQWITTACLFPSYSSHYSIFDKVFEEQVLTRRS